MSAVGASNDQTPGPGAREALGVIHGRFQPFHNGHLEYLRLARGQARQLVVGITNPEGDASAQGQGVEARFAAEANPYSYWERFQMVEAVLADESSSYARVIPFPIDEPDRLSAYLPPGATHYLRVFDEWGNTKVQRLHDAGHSVVVLEPGAQKQISGADVRTMIADGGPWEELVPAGTARILRELGLA
jgi:cytidyltransferase-like protein